MKKLSIILLLASASVWGMDKDANLQGVYRQTAQAYSERMLADLKQYDNEEKDYRAQIINAKAVQDKFKYTFWDEQKSKPALLGGTIATGFFATVSGITGYIAYKKLEDRSDRHLGLLTLASAVTAWMGGASFYEYFYKAGLKAQYYDAVASEQISQARLNSLRGLKETAMTKLLAYNKDLGGVLSSSLKS